SIEDVKSGGIDEIVLSYESTGEFYTEIFNKDGLDTTLNYGSNKVTSALVDINNDNYADVITGSNDGKVRAYDAENNRLLWERQTVGPINSSPAVGDIHPAEPGVEVTFGNDASEIHLRRGVNGVNIIPWWYTITPSTHVWTSPAIANINGDGNLDIIVGANNQYIYAFKHTEEVIPPFPLPLFGQPSSPIIGDIDGDRKSEVIVSSSDGYLHVWENMDSEVSPYLLEWPQFHHDYQRTGLFGW
ncbi:VCBS repeat-containing protein, partial [candidate division WOR-3 bacterium]|nr:VCBS repeat-containing protein [candidate division WOR-3 bacterium]